MAAGSQDQALAWWRQLLAAGVYVNLVLPPATPSGRCLLRCSLSAAHSPDQVRRIRDAFLALAESEPQASVA